MTGKKCCCLKVKGCNLLFEIMEGENGVLNLNIVDQTDCAHLKRSEFLERERKIVRVEPKWKRIC